jgi:hypothetical protein
MFRGSEHGVAACLHGACPDLEAAGSGLKRDHPIGPGGALPPWLIAPCYRPSCPIALAHPSLSPFHFTLPNDWDISQTRCPTRTQLAASVLLPAPVAIDRAPLQPLATDSDGTVIAIRGSTRRSGQPAHSCHQSRTSATDTDNRTPAGHHTPAFHLNLLCSSSFPWDEAGERAPRCRKCKWHVPWLTACMHVGTRHDR